MTPLDGIAVKLYVLILALWLTLGAGMAIGYKIGHVAGFEACQEQF